jgi:DMSO/TMAO reductase YedYZ heme-binding membrane subunit
MKTDPTLWILARASGFTAYGLLTASVLAGLVLKTRPFGKALRPATVTDLHRFLSLLGLSMLAIHGAALALDRAADVSLAALVVPGLTSYRPLWTGLGVIAAELMLLIVVSFSVRRLIGTRTWRRLHWATYVVFGAATAHGIAAGTDSGRPWALGVYLSAVGAVAAATAWRALAPRNARATRLLPTESRGGSPSNERLSHRDRPIAV